MTPALLPIDPDPSQREIGASPGLATVFRGPPFL
jgi:hypothetical protein